MSISPKPLVRIAVVIAAMSTSITVALADCETLEGAFNQAIASKAIDAAQTALGNISSDFTCGEHAPEFTAKYIAFLTGLADDASVSQADQERALSLAEASVEVSGSWKTASYIGDAYMRRGDREKAFEWYETSLTFITSRPATPASVEEKQALLVKSGAAKEDERVDNSWHPSTRGVDGLYGGIYAPGLLRDVDVLSVPLPIRFYTDETRFTQEGEAAVAELAEVAKQQQLHAMKLVGHADPRGTDQHNMDLSRRRVEAVRDELMRQGVKAKISIDWKGSREPLDTSVLAYKPGQDEIWALDRRVEWVRDGNDE